MPVNDFAIVKYPRTPHLAGSRPQPGDDMAQVPFAAIAGKNLVVEEKCDGANAALSFDANGALLLQSRGHYLTGGYREKHYDLFKRWAQAHAAAFHSALGSRYILYGEWLYAKHTVYYDALPSYFLEFDLYDRHTGYYLDTPARRHILRDVPVCAVPVLARGAFSTSEALTRLLADSCYIRPGHIKRLRAWCIANGQDADARARETDARMTMEGLYVKVEQNGRVEARVKYVRGTFLQSVAQSGAHWLERPLIPNGLRCPMEALFAPDIPKELRHVRL